MRPCRVARFRARALALWASEGFDHDQELVDAISFSNVCPYYSCPSSFGTLSI